MKLKRRPIAARYADEIEALYSAPEPPGGASVGHPAGSRPPRRLTGWQGVQYDFTRTGVYPECIWLDNADHRADTAGSVI